MAKRIKPNKKRELLKAKRDQLEGCSTISNFTRSRITEKKGS